MLQKHRLPQPAAAGAGAPASRDPLKAQDVSIIRRHLHIPTDKSTIERFLLTPRRRLLDAWIMDHGSWIDHSPRSGRTLCSSQG
jgi:hypothetical protein